MGTAVESVRNAYMLVNFGDFVDGSTAKRGDPYIQLLPLTLDLAEAHSDFVNMRQMGVDSTGEFHLLPATVLPPDNSDSNNNDDEKESFGDKIKPYIPYIIAGCAGAGLLVVVALAVCVARRRRARYRRLQDPAPAGMHMGQDAPFASYQPARRY